MTARTMDTSSPTANEKLRARFDSLASKRDRWRQRNSAYHSEIARICKEVIPPNARVLELGCATGDLLASVGPSEGTGIDLSPEMIRLAEAKHPLLRFSVQDAQELTIDEDFDYVIASDLVGLLPDVWQMFRSLGEITKPRTRVIVTYYNSLWEPVLKLAEAFRLKMPAGTQNWLRVEDIENVLELNGFSVTASGKRLLMPKKLPMVSWLLNRVVARLPLVRRLGIISYVVATRGPETPKEELTTSVIVPCWNEAGNIEDAYRRLPNLGPKTEMIFVDAGSTDGTVEVIEKVIAEGSREDIKPLLIHQGAPLGKVDAVRKGIFAASCDLIMILDSDLTVTPEDLPKFYLALAEGKGEFINGSRLVYPMEKQAMRMLNLLGNKFFGSLFSWILDQRITDTLCGTKAMFRKDYRLIEVTREALGDFDPFGDFELLFGAARHGLKIVEIPVRYRARVYGETRIRRWKHGMQCLKMAWFGMRRIKFG